MCFCYFAWRYHVHSFSGCLCLCATRTRTALSTTSQRRRRSAKHVLTSSWCRLNRVIHEISWAVHWKTRNGIFISLLHRHRMNTCFVTSQCIGCSLHCLRRLQRFPKPSTFQCQIPDWQESCILRSTNWLELALSPLIPRWLSQHREAEFTSQFQRFCLPCLVTFGCRWFKMIWYDSMIPR